MGFRCFDTHQPGRVLTVTALFLHEASCDFALFLPWLLGMPTVRDRCGGEAIKSTAVS